MSLENIVKLTDKFCFWAEQPLEKLAKAKTKKKVDPKAEVRNRGLVVFPAESRNVKDRADHFPINDENQARNAWSRCNQYSSVPSWYKGSLKELKDAVKRKIKSKYKNIEFSDNKKKSNLQTSLEKLGAMRERIDAHFDKLIAYTENASATAQRNVKFLKTLKSQYIVNFDPELEQDIIDSIPDMEKELIDSIVAMRDLHYRIKNLLDKASEASSIHSDEESDLT